MKQDMNDTMEDKKAFNTIKNTESTNVDPITFVNHKALEIDEPLTGGSEGKKRMGNEGSS